MFLSGRKWPQEEEILFSVEVSEDGILEIVRGLPTVIALSQVKRARARWTISGNSHMFN